MPTPGIPPTIYMETDVGAVVAGNGPGWVSGTPANLAASGSATAIFDLGPSWADYNLLQLSVLCAGPSTGLNGVETCTVDTPAWVSHRRHNAVGSNTPTGVYASITTAIGTAQWWVRPTGRYLLMRGTNADATNAVGATAKFSAALMRA